MEPILDIKFKTPYFNKTKFNDFKKIRALEPNFPKFPEYPKYPKTSITQLSDYLGTWVKPHSV